MACAETDDGSAAYRKPTWYDLELLSPVVDYVNGAWGDDISMAPDKRVCNYAD